jgi:hypothetical protein
MEAKMSEKQITITSQDYALATIDDPLGETVEAWAYARTDSASLHRRDLLRDKQ